MNDFEEYIRQSEPHKREKGYAWQQPLACKLLMVLNLRNI